MDVLLGSLVLLSCLTVRCVAPTDAFPSSRNSNKDLNPEMNTFLNNVLRSQDQLQAIQDLIAHKNEELNPPFRRNLDASYSSRVSHPETPIDERNPDDASFDDTKQSGGGRSYPEDIPNIQDCECSVGDQDTKLDDGTNTKDTQFPVRKKRDQFKKCLSKHNFEETDPENVYGYIRLGERPDSRLQHGDVSEMSADIAGDDDREDDQVSSRHKKDVDGSSEPDEAGREKQEDVSDSQENNEIREKEVASVSILEKYGDKNKKKKRRLKENEMEKEKEENDKEKALIDSIFNGLNRDSGEKLLRDVVDLSSAWDELDRDNNANNTYEITGSVPRGEKVFENYDVMKSRTGKSEGYSRNNGDENDINVLFSKKQCPNEKGEVKNVSIQNMTRMDQVKQTQDVNATRAEKVCGSLTENSLKEKESIGNGKSKDGTEILRRIQELLQEIIEEDEAGSSGSGNKEDESDQFLDEVAEYINGSEDVCAGNSSKVDDSATQSLKEMRTKPVVTCSRTSIQNTVGIQHTTTETTKSATSTKKHTPFKANTFIKKIYPTKATTMSETPYISSDQTAGTETLTLSEATTSSKLQNVTKEPRSHKLLKALKAKFSKATNSSKSSTTCTAPTTTCKVDSSSKVPATSEALTSSKAATTSKLPRSSKRSKSSKAPVPSESPTTLQTQTTLTTPLSSIRTSFEETNDISTSFQKLTNFSNCTNGSTTPATSSQGTSGTSTSPQGNSEKATCRHETSSSSTSKVESTPSTSRSTSISPSCQHTYNTSTSSQQITSSSTSCQKLSTISSTPPDGLEKCSGVTDSTDVSTRTQAPTTISVTTQTISIATTLIPSPKSSTDLSGLQESSTPIRTSPEDYSTLTTTPTTSLPVYTVTKHSTLLTSSLKSEADHICSGTSPATSPEHTTACASHSKSFTHLSSSSRSEADNKGSKTSPRPTTSPKHTTACNSRSKSSTYLTPPLKSETDKKGSKTSPRPTTSPKHTTACNSRSKSSTYLTPPLKSETDKKGSKTSPRPTTSPKHTTACNSRSKSSTYLTPPLKSETDKKGSKTSPRPTTSPKHTTACNSRSKSTTLIKSLSKSKHNHKCSKPSVNPTTSPEYTPSCGFSTELSTSITSPQDTVGHAEGSTTTTTFKNTIRHSSKQTSTTLFDFSNFCEECLAGSSYQHPKKSPTCVKISLVTTKKKSKNPSNSHASPPKCTHSLSIFRISPDQWSIITSSENPDQMRTSHSSPKPSKHSSCSEKCVDSHTYKIDTSSRRPPHHVTTTSKHNNERISMLHSSTITSMIPTQPEESEHIRTSKNPDGCLISTSEILNTHITKHSSSTHFDFSNFCQELLTKPFFEEPDHISTMPNAPNTPDFVTPFTEYSTTRSSTQNSASRSTQKPEREKTTLSKAMQSYEDFEDGTRSTSRVPNTFQEDVSSTSEKSASNTLPHTHILSKSDFTNNRPHSDSSSSFDNNVGPIDDQVIANSDKDSNAMSSTECVVKATSRSQLFDKRRDQMRLKHLDQYEKWFEDSEFIPIKQNREDDNSGLEAFLKPFEIEASRIDHILKNLNVGTANERSSHRNYLQGKKEMESVANNEQEFMLPHVNLRENDVLSYRIEMPLNSKPGVHIRSDGHEMMVNGEPGKNMTTSIESYRNKIEEVEPNGKRDDVLNCVRISEVADDKHEFRRSVRTNKRDNIFNSDGRRWKFFHGRKTPQMMSSDEKHNEDRKKRKHTPCGDNSEVISEYDLLNEYKRSQNNKITNNEPSGDETRGEESEDVKTEGEDAEDNGAAAEKKAVHDNDEESLKMNNENESNDNGSDGYIKEESFLKSFENYVDGIDCNAHEFSITENYDVSTMSQDDTLLENNSELYIESTSSRYGIPPGEDVPFDANSMEITSFPPFIPNLSTDITDTVVPVGNIHKPNSPDSLNRPSTVECTTPRAILGHGDNTTPCGARSTKCSATPFSRSSESCIPCFTQDHVYNENFPTRNPPFTFACSDEIHQHGKSHHHVVPCQKQGTPSESPVFESQVFSTHPNQICQDSMSPSTSSQRDGKASSIVCPISVEHSPTLNPKYKIPNPTLNPEYLNPDSDRSPIRMTVTPIQSFKQPKPCLTMHPEYSKSDSDHSPSYMAPTPIRSSQQTKPCPTINPQFYSPSLSEKFENPLNSYQSLHPPTALPITSNCLCSSQALKSGLPSYIQTDKSTGCPSWPERSTRFQLVALSTDRPSLSGNTPCRNRIPSPRPNTFGRPSFDPTSCCNLIPSRPDNQNSKSNTHSISGSTSKLCHSSLSHSLKNRLPAQAVPNPSLSNASPVDNWYQVPPSSEQSNFMKQYPPCPHSPSDSIIHPQIRQKPYLPPQLKRHSDPHREPVIDPNRRVNSGVIQEWYHVPSRSPTGVKRNKRTASRGRDCEDTPDLFEWNDSLAEPYKGDLDDGQLATDIVSTIFHFVEDSECLRKEFGSSLKCHYLPTILDEPDDFHWVTLHKMKADLNCPENGRMKRPCAKIPRELVRFIQWLVGDCKLSLKSKGFYEPLSYQRKLAEKNSEKTFPPTETTGEYLDSHNRGDNSESTGEYSDLHIGDDNSESTGEYSDLHIGDDNSESTGEYSDLHNGGDDSQSTGGYLDSHDGEIHSEFPAIDSETSTYFIDSSLDIATFTEPTPQACRRSKVASERHRLTPERSHLTPKPMRDSPERVSLSNKRTQLSPKRSHLDPELMRDSPEPVSLSKKRTQLSPKRSHLAPELMRDSPERVSLSKERTQLSSKRSHLAPKLMRDSPERVSLSKERTQLSPKRSHLAPELMRDSPERVSLSKERTQLSPKRSHLAPKLMQDSPERVSLLKERTQLSPKRSHIAPKLMREPPERVSVSKERTQLDIDLLNRLVGEYKQLADEDRVAVKPVQDYFVDQLKFLESLLGEQRTSSRNGVPSKYRET